MKAALLRWIVLALAVWVASALVPGITHDDWTSLFIAALVLGILNTFIKPILNILSLPFILVTLGLFLLVINALLLMFAAKIVDGFHVDGFWSAVGGSVVISIVSFLLGHPGRRDATVIVNRRETVSSIPRRPPPGNGPIIDV